MVTNKITPFVDYREEQNSIPLYEYFVKPDLFDRLSDNKPKIIYGTRGTGKTTLLKALTIDHAENERDFILQNDYIGIYYRADLNISSAFSNDEIPDENWYKLFSYYIAIVLTLKLFQEIVLIKDIIGLNEAAFCQDVSTLYSCDKLPNNLSELIINIKNEIRGIEKYINNFPRIEFPFIGNYASILREIPETVFAHSDQKIIKNKHFIYLIDEFENLQSYQQKAILSLVKYSNQTHTFIIGMRPYGLKVSSTIGNEYIRETDDFVVEDLDEQIKYEEFAERVCNKRIEIFYKQNGIKIDKIPKIEDFLGLNSFEDEIQLVFSDQKNNNSHKQRVCSFLQAFNISDSDAYECLYSRQELFYYLVTKLVKSSDKQRSTKEYILHEIELFKNPDKSHRDFIQNYKVAMLYYILHLYHQQKKYSGFHTLVNLSGNTLRYLIEMCNEIFHKIYQKDKTIYTNPRLIPSEIQTHEVLKISRKRLDQLQNIPDVGPRMRQFITAIGLLSNIQTEDTRLKIWEANHFVIKPSVKDHSDITFLLTECIYRGALLQCGENKRKDRYKISYDQNIYQIHPIFTPKFSISWRRKQKFDFSVQEISIMMGKNIQEINQLIEKYKKDIVSTKIDDIINYIKGNRVFAVEEENTIFDYMNRSYSDGII